MAKPPSCCTAPARLQAANPPGQTRGDTDDDDQARRAPSGTASQAMNGQWALHSHLELGALPGAPGCARLHARQVLWEWGLSAIAENAELLVSELVTNAAQATPSAGQIQPVILRLASDRSRLLILVQDTSRHPPEPAPAGHDDERGRGLLIIDAISAQWGWHPCHESSGKVVWALID